MTAVAVLAGAGLLTATAIAAALAIAGQSATAARVNQWIRERLGELVDPQTSVLNPQNWTYEDDRLVSEEAERIMGEQSPSMTIGGLDSKRSLDQVITNDMTMRWLNMSEQLRSPDDARKQLGDIRDAVQGMQDTPGGWEPPTRWDPGKKGGPGLPAGLKPAAVGLTAALARIVNTVLDGWKGLRLKDFADRVGAMVRQLFTAGESLKTAASSEGPVMVEKFRLAVNEFQLASGQINAIVRDYEMVFSGKTSSMQVIVRGVDATNDLAMLEFLRQQATNVSIMGENLSVAIKAATASVKGWAP
jgi:hypothetical protein